MKESKSKKPIIIGIITAIVIAAIVAVVVILAVNKNKEVVLNDDYFKTTADRVVYNAARNDGANYGAKSTHQVYDIKGDEITGYTFYYEYDSESKAKEAFETIQSDAEYDETIKEVKQTGKYIAVYFEESAYAGSTATEVKNWIKSLEEYENSRDAENLEWNIPEEDFEDYEYYEK